MRSRVCLLVFLSSVLLIQTVSALTPIAFPGAEGFGAYAEGGRGGDVYIVTNTHDSGPGSLREGIDTASGPRTIVFAVSGLIALESDLKVDKDYMTIAGQTAPGDGICLKNYPVSVKADHVVVRYIRSRLGDNEGQESDALSVVSGHNVIVDHCSASWSVDEVLSCSTSTSNGIDKVTVQWCMITEALRNSIHEKGSHSYASLVRGSYGVQYSYHHNLYAHNHTRNPRPGNYAVMDSPDFDTLGLEFDFRNNVIYNWGSRPGYDADPDNVTTRMNFVGNWYQSGPDSVGTNAYEAGSKAFRACFDDNYMDGVKPSDPYSVVDFGGWSSSEIDDWSVSTPFQTGPIVTDSAPDAYTKVLAGAGASRVRDSIDAQIVADVINGTGEIIDDEDEVGGWPTYASTTAATDTDQDGMPDDWETDHGLNPNDASDRNGTDLSGSYYTNLEVYMNSLVAEQEQTGWAVDFADAIITRWPSTIDDMTGKGWEYGNGIVLRGIEAVYQQTGDPVYFNYIKDFVDSYIGTDGMNVRTTDSLDILQPTILCLFLYEETGEEKYKNAADKVVDYLMNDYPRNTVGGFWHKDNYPNQIWVDSMYMGAPLLARYGASLSGVAGAADESSAQVLLCASHLQRPDGLFYHGWDESKLATWADPTTGLSSEVWSRGTGWFAMALVDILEYLPSNHPDREQLLTILRNLAGGLETSQDPATGLWWQVMDKGGQQGNYLEASGSGMFVYALKKAVDRGYINASYMDVAEAGWEGMKSRFDLYSDGMPRISGYVRGMGIRDNYDAYMAESVEDCPSSEFPHGYCAALMASAAMEYDYSAPVQGGDSLANNFTHSADCGGFQTDPNDKRVQYIHDGDTSTPAAKGSSDTIWVEYDFGEDYNLTSARIFGDDQGGWNSQSWSLQAWDGTNYVDVFTHVPCFGQQWYEQTFDVVSSKAKVIVNGTTNGTEVFEIEIRGAPAVPQTGILAAWDFASEEGASVPAGWTTWSSSSMTNIGSSSSVGDLTLTHTAGSGLSKLASPTTLTTQSDTPLLTANEGVWNDVLLTETSQTLVLSGLKAGQDYRVQFVGHCKTSTNGTRNVEVVMDGAAPLNLFEPVGVTGEEEASYSSYLTFTATDGDVSFVFNKISAGASTGVSGMIVEGVARPISGYDAWAVAQGITGGPTDDDDGDGLDNLSEYAVGEKPTFVKMANGFDFVHKERKDDANLSYSVQTCTDLTSGVWTDLGVADGTVNIDGTFDRMIHEISDTESQTYVRVLIETP